MKKPVLIIAAVLLAAAIIVAVMLMPKKLSVSDVTAAADGQTIYLTVTLEKPVTGTTMAIEYNYDASVLEALPQSSSWIPQGRLQDFSTMTSHGVWTNVETTELSGELCVLAFQVRPDAEYSKSTVRCTLTVHDENGGQRSFAASGRIVPACRHKFSKWQQADSGHSRSCAACGKVQTLAHNWNSGKKSTDDSGAEIIVFSCKDCNAKTSAISPDVLNPQENTIPSGSGNSLWGNYFGGNTQNTTPATEPSVPTESQTSPYEGWMGAFQNGTSLIPTEGDTEATIGNQNNPGFQWGSNLWPSATTEPSTDEHGHEHTTAPAEDPHEGHDHDVPTEDPHAGHNYGPIEQDANSVILWIVVAALVLSAAAAVLFLTKKKHP